MVTTLIQNITDTLSALVSSIAQNIRTGFTALMYNPAVENGTATVSDFAQFVFICIGIALALSIGRLVVRAIRMAKHSA